MALVPPLLPPFLSDRFELKVIEGSPLDEEVKVVHAVSRALNDAASVPGLYDADLAMKLSGYLFSIQMTRYREIHPMVIFPTNTTHTPPTLPIHIPVDLKPVAGSPTDDEVKNAQEALRIAENMVHVPSMFDANLSMKLSQHLFNIQFERYIHQTIGRPAPNTTEPQDTTPNLRSADDIHGNSSTNPVIPQPSSRISSIDSGSSSMVPSPIAVNSESEATKNTEDQAGQDRAKYLKAEVEDTHGTLVRIAERLDNMARFIVTAQQSAARSRNNGGSWYPFHSVLNDKGEDCRFAGLPYLPPLSYNSDPGSAYDETLALHLRFYGIGAEMVESGGQSTLIEGKRVDAVNSLKSHLGI